MGLAKGTGLNQDFKKNRRFYNNRENDVFSKVIDFISALDSLRRETSKILKRERHGEKTQDIG